MSGGFDSGFSNGLDGSSGFNLGFSKRRVLGGGGGGLATPGALFTNLDTYITDGVRALHSNPATAGSPGFLGFITRSNITRTMVLKVDSTITVQGFKFVRTPEASSAWTTVTFDDMDVVLTVKSGGSINGGALSTKTFATNSKVRSAVRTAVVNPMTVNTNRTEYDIYTVYDASAVTLTAGTYTAVYRGVNTQIGVAVFHTSLIPIPTSTQVYPDPTDAANTSYYPVMEILSTAP
jgi:hypothetical protein